MSDKITSLIYHDLIPLAMEGAHGGDDFYAVKESEFLRQMEYIKWNGYVALTLDDLMAIWSRPEDLPAKSVLITFDDGWASHYTVGFCILKELGLKAEFFVTADLLDTDGFMTGDQLREMNAHGFSIQSHSLSHPMFNEISTERQREEIEGSKAVIEEMVGSDVRYLSLPGGRYDSSTFDLARSAGYSAVCTSIVGQNAPGDDPFMLKRICVRYNTGLDSFRLMLEGDLREIYMQRIKSSCSRFLTRFIGTAGIERIKKRLIKGG